MRTGRIAISLLALGAGCAPSVHMRAPDAEGPVLVGRAPGPGERVTLELGWRPPKSREANLPDFTAVRGPGDDERMQDQLTDALRGCPRCSIHVVWIDAKLEWLVLLGQESSTLRAPAVVVEPPGDEEGER